MKKIIMGLIAASVLAAPAAAAPFNAHNGRDQVQQTRTKIVQRNNGRQIVRTRQVVRTDRFRTHRWNKGQRFDSRYAQNYRVINNPRAYRLHDAPRGYRWVQSGNDAVLVAVASGLIGAVLAGAIN